MHMPRSSRARLEGYAGTEGLAHTSQGVASRHGIALRTPQGFELNSREQGHALGARRPTDPTNVMSVTDKVTRKW